MQPGRTHLVSCPCGADVRIDPHRPERSVVCPKCGAQLDFVVTIDPKSVKPRVSIVVPPQTFRIEGESLAKRTRPVKPVAAAPPPPAPKTIRGLLAECPCGASFPVDAAKLPILQACPQCKASYYVTARTDPSSKKRIAVLLPQKAAAQPSRTSSPKTRTGKTRLGLSPVAPAKAETVIPSRKGRTRTVDAVKPPPKPAAPEPPPGAQVVQCECGEHHIVRRRDLNVDVPCACGRTLRFEETRDPQTLAPKIRIRPASPDA